MNYKNYIISFHAGTSGRFVKVLLDRIIKNSEEPVNIDEKNTAHNNIIPTYVDLILDDCDVNDQLVFNYLQFLDTGTSIFSTHMFPNFKLLNDKFTDLGIIIIKFEYDDLDEIMLNALYKNNHILNPQKITDLKIKRRLLSSRFYLPINPVENCLILNYKQIYEKNDENYVVLEKLKTFTGAKNIPNSTIHACNRYSLGRDILLKEAGLR